MLDHNQASGVYLSDGVINMAVLRYKLDEVVYKEGGKDYIGLHHFGFWVDDLEADGGRLRQQSAAPAPRPERADRGQRQEFGADRDDWPGGRQL